MIARATVAVLFATLNALALAIWPTSASCQVQLVSSNLPILIVDTNGQSIRDEPKIRAAMRAIDNGPNVRNNVADPANAYDGVVGIEYRGSSSLVLFPKKSFAVETRNADGSNRNLPLLGLPTENDWVLHGPYSDKSLMRNVLAFHIARATGRYASRWRFVELIANDEYLGIYVLLERVKRDNDRIAISPIRPEDTTGDAVTGGYILKIDKFDGAQVDGWFSRYPTASDPSRRTFYQYHYPRPSDITDAQRAYIQGAVDDFETVLTGEEFDDPQQGYRRMVDVGSVIDYILVSEFTHNVDAYRLSTFFFKDKDSISEQFVMGPPWDYNIAFGNANYYQGESTSGFRIRYSVPAEDGFHGPAWWTRFLDDPAFVDNLVERWVELRKGALADDSLATFIGETGAMLEEAQSRNFQRWPVLNTWVWPNVGVHGSWEAEVDYLTSWLGRRAAWLDAHIPSIGGPPGLQDPENGAGVGLTIHPNPAADQFVVSVSLSDVTARVQLKLYDTLGRLVALLDDRFVTGSEAFTASHETSTLAAGVYFVSVEVSGGAIAMGTAIVL